MKPTGCDKATVELRADGTRNEWCVVHEGKTYPFGRDEFGKDIAQYAAYRLENGKDSYKEDPSFTTVVYAG